MTDWLLKFGLGGVQPFIGQARKVRDLAAGSELVSHLSRTAVKAVPAGCEVLLPYDPSGVYAACPHQVVVRAGSEQDARGCAEAMARAAMSARDVALDPEGWRHRRDLGVIDDGRAIRSQIDGAFEWCWVAVPETPDFETAFPTLLARYEDRRRTRTFGQVEPLSAPHANWACSQCGARAAVMQPDRAALTRLAARESGLFSARDRLCAVCLARRLWVKGRRFPSTLTLAAARLRRSPWFLETDRRLQALGLGEAEREELWSLDQAEVAERLAALEAEASAEVAQLTAASRLLYPDGSSAARPGYSPYYAMVVADGDRMGEWFSGARFERGRVGDLRAAQRQLAAVLAGFAARLKQDVAALGGTLVYSGGDDALVLCGTDALLPLMQRLHESWREAMAPLASVAAGGALPTISLHASVVHEKAPMQPVVARLHEWLDHTKEAAGRDAFSVRTAVRSGGDPMLIGKWDELPGLAAAVEAFSNWSAADDPASPPDAQERRQRAGWALPTGLLYKLHASLDGFFDPGTGRLDLRDALDGEMRRLFVRSGATTASRAAGRPADVRRWLMARAAGAAARGGGLTEMQQALSVVSFLARTLDWGTR